MEQNEKELNFIAHSQKWVFQWTIQIQKYNKNTTRELKSVTLFLFQKLIKHLCFKIFLANNKAPGIDSILLIPLESLEWSLQCWGPAQVDMRSDLK